MTDNIAKPCLALIAGSKAAGNAAKTVLSGEFVVTQYSPADFRVENVSKNIPFYVLLGNIAEFVADTLCALQHEVTKNDAVLMLCGNVPDYGLNKDFFHFVGVARVGMEPAADIQLRVFPHYLTQSLDEYETIHSGVLRYRTQKPLTTNDNIFLKNAADGTPVAFERVYGRKGRVLFVSLCSTPDSLDHITLTFLKNLSKIKITADSIEGSFGPVLPATIPFDKGVVTERLGAVGRWNALYTLTNGDAVYSHSSLFLPASPEFFLDSKIQIWKSGVDITREKLLKSLSSVEVRNTDFCNEDCYYCFNRKSTDLAYTRTSIPDELHRKMERDLLDLRTNYDCSFFIRYTGSGEPLIHKRTLPSLIAFEQAGIPTALITNGSTLTSITAAELGKYATFVRFSIDAANANTYASIRRCNKEMFYRTLEAIKTINRMRKTLIGVTFLICRQNFTQIVEFCVLMKRIGVKVIWLRSMNDPDEFSATELIRIDTDIRRVRALNDDHFHVFAVQFSIYRKVNTLHYRYDEKRCWSRFTKAVIQPNGDVIACLSHKDFVLGNIYDTLFSEIWGGKRHIAFVKSGNYLACSQCIESRFNNSLEFMYRHDGEEIVKAQRMLRN